MVERDGKNRNEMALPSIFLSLSLSPLPPPNPQVSVCSTQSVCWRRGQAGASARRGTTSWTGPVTSCPLWAGRVRGLASVSPTRSALPPQTEPACVTLCSSLCGRAGEDCVHVVWPLAWSRYYGRCVTLCSSLCGRAGEDCVHVVWPLAWSRYYGRCVTLCSSSCGRAGKDCVDVVGPIAWSRYYGRCVILCSFFVWKGR